MQKILKHVLGSDLAVQSSTEAYYDEIVVDTAKIPIERLMAVLKRFGLEAKLPMAIDGGRAWIGGESSGKRNASMAV